MMRASSCSSVLSMEVIEIFPLPSCRISDSSHTSIRSTPPVPSVVKITISPLPVCVIELPSAAPSPDSPR